MDFKTASFEEVHALANEIEGWLCTEEAQLLYNTVLNLKKSATIVEIGSWCSKSLTYITAAAIKSQNNNKIFSIDPFLTSKDEPNGQYETFKYNLNKNGIIDRIIHIKEKSQIAGLDFNETIEFIFIDGFHKYESVKKDFELFFPKIIEEGYIAIHDIISFEGPTILVKELVDENVFKILDIQNTLLLAQKKSVLSEKDKNQNKIFIDKIDYTLNKFNIKMQK